MTRNVPLSEYSHILFPSLPPLCFSLFLSCLNQAALLHFILPSMDCSFTTVLKNIKAILLAIQTSEFSETIRKHTQTFAPSEVNVSGILLHWWKINSKYVCFLFLIISSFKFIILTFAFNYYELMIFDRLQLLQEAILVIVLLILKPSQISFVKSFYLHSLTNL